MSTRSVGASLGLLLVLASTPAAGAQVTVNFVEPQHYIDAGSYGRDTARNLRALQGHLETLGRRCLIEGETLELQVLDVDLAGQNEWWHGGYDLRVMRDITWPRLELAYVWRDAAGHVLAEGHERVADLNYLSRSAYVRFDADRLPYEKVMLRNWFERRFCRGEREAALG